MKHAAKISASLARRTGIFSVGKWPTKCKRGFWGLPHRLRRGSGYTLQVLARFEAGCGLSAAIPQALPCSGFSTYILKKASGNPFQG
jgi:hypothetical protein